MHPNENKSCYDPEKQDSNKGLGKLGLSDHKHQDRKVTVPEQIWHLYGIQQSWLDCCIIKKPGYVGVNQGLGLVHLSLWIPKKKAFPSQHTNCHCEHFKLMRLQTHGPLWKQEHCCMHWKQSEIVLQPISKLSLQQQEQNNFYTINCHLCLPSIKSCLQWPAV